MSKDFEQAYRELAESEIPDLWDRIEAGLENRSTPEGEAPAKKEEKSAADTSSKKRKVRIFLRRHSGTAAAAVCVAVLIPAAVLIFGIGSGRLLWRSGRGAADMTEGIDTAAAPQKEEMELAAEDNGGVDSADAAECEAASEEAVCTESAEEETDAGGMDAGDMAGTLDSSLTSAEPAEAGGGEGTQGINNTQNDLEDPVSEMSDAVNPGEERKKAGTASTDIQQKDSESEESVRQESASIKAEEAADDTFFDEFISGTVFEYVEIEVKEVQNDFGREDGSVPGTFYTVTVKKDVSGQLAEGKELVIDIPAYSSIALPEGGMFEVDLIYRGDGIYGLEKCHRQITE